jgi:hypothetical protein
MLLMPICAHNDLGYSILEACRRGEFRWNNGARCDVSTGHGEGKLRLFLCKKESFSDKNAGLLRVEHGASDS